VSFACSLNNPLINRAALLGQGRVKTLIEGFGFNMPPASTDGESTPPSTAAVLGLISGSPRRVHHMAGVVLGAMIDQGGRPVRPPSLVKAYDFTAREHAEAYARDSSGDIVPGRLIRRDGVPMLKALLQAPLCYQTGGKPAGTLRHVAEWCAERRGDLRLHFAKTGTMVTEDPNATVDTWIAGGLQFQNGAAYSYVVLVGTGSAREAWATNVHASQAGTRLLAALLGDLARHAKGNAQPSLLPPRPATPVASADVESRMVPTAKKGPRPLATDEQKRVFGTN
jgi:hypothetical protein